MKLNNLLMTVLRKHQCACRNRTPRHQTFTAKTLNLQHLDHNQDTSRPKPRQQTFKTKTKTSTFKTKTPDLNDQDCMTYKTKIKTPDLQDQDSKTFMTKTTTLDLQDKTPDQQPST